MYQIGNFYGGFHLVANPLMVERVQRKTHRKKRINKKWRKRYGFVEKPSTTCYLFGTNTIIAHPDVILRIKLELMLRETGKEG